MKLRYSARTDVGQKREINEDSYGPQQLDLTRTQGQLMVLCDGMGGHAAGEVASGIGVEAIMEVYYGTPGDDRADALRHAFEEANRRIYTSGHGSMGTTGVAALIYDGTITVANVGDSRAYLVHDGAISQVSRDHSYVSEQVEAGLLTPEQARTSAVRNIITRALGHQDDVQVDLFRLVAHQGDIVVLSSDGLHGLVEDDEIQEAVRLSPPEEVTRELIKLANQRGGGDNITVMVTRLDRLDDANDGASGELSQADDRTTLVLPETTAEFAPPPSVPAGLPKRSVEHPLSRNGLLLALLTLIVLVTGGGFVLLNPTPAIAPTDMPVSSTAARSPIDTAEAASPVPTTQATPVRTAATVSPLVRTTTSSNATSSSSTSAVPGGATATVP